MQVYNYTYYIVQLLVHGPVFVLSDHLDRYLSSPTLIQTIPGTVSILGITKLNNELYVLRCTSIEAAAHVQVFSIAEPASSFASMTSLNASTIGLPRHASTPNMTLSPHSLSEFTEVRRLGYKQLRDPKDLAAGQGVLYLSDFGGRVLVSEPSGSLLFKIFKNII